MCSCRRSSVTPKAWYRGSCRLCLLSTNTRRGWLKKTCSVSDWRTECLSLLFRALPSSQSNPVICVQSIMTVYYHHIHNLQAALTINCSSFRPCWASTGRGLAAAPLNKWRYSALRVPMERPAGLAGLVPSSVEAPWHRLSITPPCKVIGNQIGARFDVG